VQKRQPLAIFSMFGYNPAPKILQVT